MVKEFSSNLRVLIDTFEEKVTYNEWAKVGEIKAYHLEDLYLVPDVLNRFGSKNGYYMSANFEDEAYDGEDWVSFYFTELSEEEMLKRMIDHANRHKDRYESFLNLIETQKTVEKSLNKEDDDLLEALEKVSK